MSNQIDIKKLTLIELKSLCYDQGKALKMAEQAVKILESEIAMRESLPPAPDKETEDVEGSD